MKNSDKIFQERVFLLVFLIDTSCEILGGVGVLFQKRIEKILFHVENSLFLGTAFVLELCYAVKIVVIIQNSAFREQSPHKSTNRT